VTVEQLPTICVTIDQAASMIGMSTQVIRRAIAQGNLTPRYPTARPVILVDDLRAWVESSPTEPHRQRSA